MVIEKAHEAMWLQGAELQTWPLGGDLLEPSFASPLCKSDLNNICLPYAGKILETSAHKSVQELWGETGAGMVEKCSAEGMQRVLIRRAVFDPSNVLSKLGQISMIRTDATGTENMCQTISIFK